MTAQPTPPQRPPERADFRFSDRLRVRWAEVDMQKIVFNGHYLMYFDTAVAAYWRALALPYHDTMHALQGDLYVRKATLEYEGSARYDDVCDVGMRCARIGKSSMLFQAAVFRGEQRLVHGELVYVFADPATQTSQPVPAALRAVLEAYETGAEMLALQEAPWPAAADEITSLRSACEGEAASAASAPITDTRDAPARHLLARNRLGRLVACGRLLQGPGTAGEISRLAVLPALRGSGIGQAVLSALVRAGRLHGLTALQADVPPAARGLFDRAGFRPTDSAQPPSPLKPVTPLVPMLLTLQPQDAAVPPGA